MTSDKVYYSTGRGGAGNIKTADQMPSPKLVPQGSNTPQLSSERITTGRGGYGNMVKNDDPNLTRKLQDVDGPSDKTRENHLYAVTSNKAFAVGRGGFGNVVTSKSNESGDENHLTTVMSAGPDNQKQKGLLGKIGGFFKSKN